ncbi:peptidyl-prolyl cis-trans isomerase [Niallia sp. 03133]|uniref:peptidyl-prolyl cis-trans isomerase n=1 Tax=Niallia sp. 03133 TaxID=3458060 RepID=UPI0040448D49
MEPIIPIKGAVAFHITIDPSVWIFDARKITENQLFASSPNEDALVTYTKEISRHWDKEITEGAAIPPVRANKITDKKEDLLKGTYFMPLAPFISHAEPFPDAEEIIIHTKNDEVAFPLLLLDEIYLLFCRQGKAIQEDGPVHLYVRNKGIEQRPVKYIQGIQVR